MKAKKFLGWAIYLTVCSIAGGFLGFFLKKLPPETFQSIARLFDNGLGLPTLPNLLLNVGITLFLFLMALFLQILVHETGHLFFGWLSGYRFVSLRIGSFMVIKEDNRLKWKRFDIAGTGGQCLMEPPEKGASEKPYLLYNLGGSLANLLIAAISLLLFTVHLPYPFGIFCFTLFATGLFFGLMNAIPLRFSQIGNDGYNILLIRRDPIARQSFFLQLKVNALLTKGIRLKEMPIEWFRLPEGANLDNYLHAIIRYMEFAWHFDRLDFEKARESLQTLAPHVPNQVGLYQKEIRCEQVFFGILEGKNKEETDRLFDGALKKYAAQYSPYMISKTRLLYAYALLVEKDEKEATRLYEKAAGQARNYPVRAEAESEMEMVDYVKGMGQKIHCEPFPKASQ